MNKRKIALSFAAAVVFSSVISFNTSAADDIHTVMVMDFNGDARYTFTIADGEKLDLGEIDTDMFDEQLDIYTQRKFDSWGNIPESGIVTKDLAIYALYKEMTISCDNIPQKTEYFSNKGNINIDDLKVSITVHTQTPEKDSKGNFIITEEIVNIEDACKPSPANLDEAFTDGSLSAVIDIFPPESSRAIVSYDIKYFPNLGDVNLDGNINAVDASVILRYYSSLSTGENITLTEEEWLRCDINRNNIIDSSDSSKVLSYYSILSTSNNPPSWDEFLSE